MVEITLRFAGLDAAKHRIDMRQLGRSLIGVEKVVQDSLWVAAYSDAPQGRKKLDLSVQVDAPKAACVEIVAAVIATPGLLPLAQSLATNLGSDFIWHMISGTLLRHGGRAEEASPHLSEALGIIARQQELVAKDRKLEREAVAKGQTRTMDAMMNLVDRLAPQARAIVEPVGRSAENLLLPGPKGWATTDIDVATADAVRSAKGDQVSELQQMMIWVDGVISHSRTLKVEDPQHPGRYVSADVRDPVFDEPENIYTTAIRKFLEVTAKATYRDGQLHKLHIMDAKLPA